MSKTKIQWWRIAISYRKRDVIYGVPSKEGKSLKKTFDVFAPSHRSAAIRAIEMVMDDAGWGERRNTYLTEYIAHSASRCCLGEAEERNLYDKLVLELAGITGVDSA